MNKVVVKADGASAATTVITGAASFGGVLIGTDGANDPEITVYDNTEAALVEILPTTVYDASALGLNGAMIPHPIHCSIGIHVTVTADGGGAFGGVAEVTVLYRQI